MAPNCLMFLVDVRRQLSNGRRSRTVAISSEQVKCDGVGGEELRRDEQDIKRKFLAAIGEQRQQIEAHHGHIMIENKTQEEEHKDADERLASAVSAKNEADDGHGELHRRLKERLARKSQETIRFAQLAACPSSANLLYNMTSATHLMFTIALLLTISSANNFLPMVDCQVRDTSSSAPSAAATSPAAPANEAKPPTPSAWQASNHGPLSSIDWPRIGSQLVRQFTAGGHHRDRWVNLQVTGENSRNQYRRPAGGLLGSWGGQAAPSRRPWQQQQNHHSPLASLGSSQYNRFNRVWDEFRTRLGARNTIRVHNAFRDFAWRMLSRLSMPTPVIYELRRQHLYPSEEDAMNDMLFNRNTSKTIRSKRHLNIGERFRPALQDEPPGGAAASQKQAKRRADDDDDEDR